MSDELKGGLCMQQAVEASDIVYVRKNIAFYWDEKMDKVSRGMCIRMGFVMSFFMCLIGNIASKHFSFEGFFVSWAACLIISYIVGYFVPVGKIGSIMCARHNIKFGTLKCKFTRSLASNLIYTPVLTLTMVGLAYAMALKKTGGLILVPFWEMLLKSFSHLVFKISVPIYTSYKYSSTNYVS